MLDKYNHILDYFRGAWLKRKYFYISAWLVCLIGWTVVALLPNQYESKARVHVDTESILEPLLKGLTVEVDTSAKIQLMVKTLLSRENLEKIIKMTDLDIDADTPEKYEQLIIDLSEDFIIKKERAGNIFNFSIRDNDPVMAKNIVESALNVFIESTLLDNRTDADSAKKFIDEQIQYYERKLIESEQALAKFKQDNAEVLPNLMGGYYALLKDEKEKLKQAELAYKITKSKIQKDVKSLTNYASKVEFESSFDDRIAYLHRQLDEASMRYRDIHPDIIELKRRIAEVEGLRDHEIEEKRSAFENNPELASAGFEGKEGELNVIKEMQVTMHSMSSEMTEQQVTVSEFKERVKALEAKLNIIPLIEAELKELNRGYDNNKAKYEDFLTRRSSVQIASEADNNAEKIQFNIINPPLVATKPVGPKHILLTLGVLIAGLGMGGALAFLTSQINPVATSNSGVTKASGYPVLGTVEASDELGLNEEKSKAIRNFIVSNIELLGVMSVFTVYFLIPHVITKVIGLVKGFM